MKTSDLRPHGIMFHHFYNEKHIQGQGAISADELAQIIEFYQQSYRILPARDWLEKANQGTLADNEACLTFDDALLCQYEVALPVLQQFDLTAFWFVYSSVITGGSEKLEIYRKFRTACFESIDEFYRCFFRTIGDSPYQADVATALRGFIPEEYLKQFPFYTNPDRQFRFVRDQVLGPAAYTEVLDLMMLAEKIDLPEFTSDLWMNDQQVLDLHDREHVIGLHSHTHPTALAALDADVQRAEYQTNFETLNRILRVAPDTVSHPCNSYNTDTLKILKDLEIKVGFRSNMAEQQTSQLEFPREDHANIMDKIAA
ncbi:polysaccharide deacetylase family protein [Gimesia panareensis]|uniref:polysaccharide deacetylase family protein n=1 Tax=Gimesia panareensis TaxID=2527978 RepID=UPI001189E608|nr:polysaccharide deacetylase family protein [Gimesia panareensis]QDU49375.1 Polysaccharide deacetylase [Gimesia panareensis]